MSKILPEQDCLFPDFTQKCVNYVDLKIATKQPNLLVQIQCSQHCLHQFFFVIITKTQIRQQQKRVTDCCLVEVRVVAVQAGSADMALPLKASRSPGSLPCWPWRQNSTWERILDKDSPK